MIRMIFWERAQTMRARIQMSSVRRVCEREQSRKLGELMHPGGR
ncbi:hypothetical protein ADILRU_2528 [Leifsonia rubra CMS 76R]|nr:hypothetical protein ADILRU_2528 [Leifsonia rubra CMS 76R]